MVQSAHDPTKVGENQEKEEELLLYPGMGLRAAGGTGEGKWCWVPYSHHPRMKMLLSPFLDSGIHALDRDNQRLSSLFSYL